MINIKKLIEEIIEIYKSEKGIFEIIEDIIEYLQSTRSTHDDITSQSNLTLGK